MLLNANTWGIQITTSYTASKVTRNRRHTRYIYTPKHAALLRASGGSRSQQATRQADATIQQLTNEQSQQADGISATIRAEGTVSREIQNNGVWLMIMMNEPTNECLIKSCARAHAMPRLLLLGSKILMTSSITYFLPETLTLAVIFCTDSEKWTEMMKISGYEQSSGI